MCTSGREGIVRRVARKTAETLILVASCFSSNRVGSTSESAPPLISQETRILSQIESPLLSFAR